ncbi:hypothetical protein [Flammeovirga kamogawensis]|uniref:Organic solvent tolerance-like N-terminal domain-containing protein n=1 Tax=Flammeovirga kamogawensis TaxID=373891 RepID=A0ABX8GR35_9BACT|nr:hypothetical protein [Flammeovirga kamogawensis]MBB6462145.1 hypothetical protein [Flammeovirga kamogawensis]QWG05879.1 hypothetical protein KM029_10890 [Flammeovirga kamogawensis]TRX67703.1 hypothetical protein EO216_05900 [Flammeovirga kamogawensis]
MKNLTSSFFIFFFTLSLTSFGQTLEKPTFKVENIQYNSKTDIYILKGNIKTTFKEYYFENDSAKFNFFDDILTFYGSKEHPIKIYNSYYDKSTNTIHSN